MPPALTCAHSADPIGKMSQWIHLLKVLAVQAHERDAQEMLQRWWCTGNRGSGFPLAAEGLGGRLSQEQVPCRVDAR